MTDSRLEIVAHALHVNVCGQTLDREFDLFLDHLAPAQAILDALDAAEPEETPGRDLAAENRELRFRLEKTREALWRRMAP